MVLDRTTASNLLKEFYAKDKMINMTFGNRPLMAMIPKDTKLTGANFDFLVHYGNPQSVSHSGTKAITNAASTNSNRAKFVVPPAFTFGAVQIYETLILSTSTDAGSFLRAVQSEIDAIIESQSNQIAVELYGTGYGSVGRLSATASISAKVITLARVEDVANFDVGSRLDVASGDNSGALRARGSSANPLIVTAIDRNAGTLTFAYNVTDATNGIPTLAVSDYLFPDGCREDASSPTRQAVAGLAGWIPTTAPTTGDSFCGVDRSVDSRLFGLRYDGTQGSVKESLVAGANRVATQGGSVSHFFMHFNMFEALCNELGSNTRYVDVTSKSHPTIGFSGVEIATSKGKAVVVADQFCPSDKVYGLALDTWSLKSMGDVVGLSDSDGNGVLRSYNDFKVEARLISALSLVCKAPGHNVVITF